MGETGLDYFYTPETKAQQQSSFRDHIRIGRELNKPVIVHTRDARADTLAILREEKVTDCGGVLHCFTEDRRQRASCSIWGSISRFPVSSLFVTPSSCVMRRATCRWIACWLKPIRRTAPVPHRGKENQPALVRDVAEYMAVLKGVSLEQLAQQTTDNFATLFHIDPARLQPA